MQIIIIIVSLEEKSELKLVCKLEFDDTYGYGQYKQIFANGLNYDKYLFFTALVLRKLIDLKRRRDVWMNPRLSPTLYCRPLNLFKKKRSSNTKNWKLLKKLGNSRPIPCIQKENIDFGFTTTCYS